MNADMLYNGVHRMLLSALHTEAYTDDSPSAYLQPPFSYRSP